MTLGNPDLASLLLVIPGVSALVLAAVPGYRLSAQINVAASGLTFLCAGSLLFQRPAPGLYLFVDDLNIVFVVLSTFIGFTTSAFSASYIEHEIETGQTAPPPMCASITPSIRR